MKRPALLFALCLTAALGCEKQQPQIPAKIYDPMPPGADQGGVVFYTPEVAPLESADAVEPTPTPAAPATPQGARGLTEILLELEEIEGLSANLDDPEADHAARIERPRALLDEAEDLGLASLDEVAAALIAQQDPEQAGAIRREWLCELLARHAPAAPERCLAILADLPAEDARALTGSLPTPEARRTLRAWFLQRARFAQDTGGGDPALRALLLERLVALGELETDVRAAASKDPSERVRKLLR